MIKKSYFVLFLGMLPFLTGYAQEDAYLQKLTEGVVQLREAKSSSEVLNKTVLEWSASGCPKITLMDEIRRDPDNEYRGSGVNKFKMNQVVTHVYNRQNIGMVSRDVYFNSMEKDIFYSAIEKTIKKKRTVTYTLTGHGGAQEFVFVVYDPKASFSVEVNGQPALPVSGMVGVLSVKLPKVKKEDKLMFSITNDSSSYESFVILNHNPQE